MKKIFIIEDDVWISNSLKIYLESSDYKVDVQYTWEMAAENILNNDYDLIILDINLPVENWIDICKKVRVTSQIPIIMLTARNNESDKVKLLEIWADDYISKPFSPRELLARINTIIRRSSKDNKIEEKNNNKLKYNDIIIDLDKLVVTKNNTIISFTKNEFDILKKIIEEDWKIVTRETLMVDIIWYNQYVYDRTIDTHIKNIRKKIDDKDMIITIRWEWYRLNK